MNQKNNSKASNNKGDKAANTKSSNNKNNQSCK